MSDIPLTCKIEWTATISTPKKDILQNSDPGKSYLLRIMKPNRKLSKEKMPTNENSF
jgi:hypothetical protein